MTESLMDLNIKCVEDDQRGINGFASDGVKSYSQRCPEQVNTAKSKDDCYETNRCRDVNKPIFPTIDENYAKSKLQTQVLVKRSQYLEIARSKYYFQDDGIPSFRLFEIMDDNGKDIEEPELHRPLGMDDYTYNQNCELAIQQCKDLEDKNLSKDEYISSPNWNRSSNDKLSSDNIAAEDVNNEYEMSIHCAQRATSTTGLTNSPIRGHALTQQCTSVDLVSPLATISTEEHKSMKQSNSSNFQTPDSTPGFQILGEKPFVHNCNSMSDATDEFYNASLSLGSSGSRHGKENCPPKRIPQGSKYLRSPYDVNPSQTPSIQPFEHKIWEAVTTLCDDAQHQLDWTVNIDTVRVKMLQLGNSLKLEGWLDVWVMNAFCRKLFRDNHPRKTKKHFFFNTISDAFLEKWRNEEGKLFMQKRALDSFSGANKAHKLYLSDGLYFPTVANSHWFVFLLDIKDRNFIFLDSFFGQESSHHKGIDNILINNFQRTWEEAGLRQMNFNTFGRAYPNVPRQGNGNDCGIFGMKNMELFVPRCPAN